MNLDEWYRNGAYFTDPKKGHNLFFRKEGKGPVLLLLHGFPTASWDWHKIWPELSGQFTLLAPDFLGFGYSDKPFPHAYQIAEQADLVSALLKDLKVHSLQLLCHDYGNTVGQELLARSLEKSHPYRIDRISFLNGGLFPESHQARPIQKLLAGSLGSMLTPFLSKSNLRRSLNQVFGPQTPPSPQELDSFWQLIKFNRGVRCLPPLLRYMQERKRNRSRWVGALEQFRGAICLIDGLADPVSGLSLVNRYRELLPEQSVVEVPGIGHYPQLEAPNVVLENLL